MLHLQIVLIAMRSRPEMAVEQPVSGSRAQVAGQWTGVPQPVVVVMLAQQRMVSEPWARR